jgi:hypothetical protein
MANTTLLDIQKLNGNDQSVGLIEENLRFAPEIEVLPFRTIRGTSYKTGVRTGFPTTSFRAANDGFTPSKSTFVDRLIECYIFGGSIQADKAVADAYEDGAAAWQMIEADGVAKSAMLQLGKQVFYGVTEDSLGFPGLKAATPFGDSTEQGDALTVDAGGTTGSTASSVYAVSFGVQNVTLVGGMSSAFELGDFRIQNVLKNSKEMEAYVANMTSWIGMQVGNENAVRRIANLTDDSGKGLTDAKLADLMATFPVGYMPDAIFMSRRSRTQLQQSRTVTLQGQGRNRPNQPTIAPLPTEYDGVQIITTDSILNTDAIES